jgi:drug/metabolite transporter (DMT)-like permease
MYVASTLAVMASVAMTVGLYLMKQQAERLPPLLGGWRLPAWWGFVRDPWWLLGALLQVIGFALYFAALRGAPLSVVHTAMNGGVALFVLMAVVGLGERPRPFEWVGVGCVSAGLIALGVSLADNPPASAVAHGTLPFSVVLVVLSVVALATGPHPGSGIGLSIASGLMFGLADVFAKGLAGAESFAAAMWSYNLELTVAANLIGFALMQAAMQVGRGVVVVPIFSTLSNVVPIIGGLLVYREWETAGASAGLRPLAFVLAIGGAALLAVFGEQATHGPSSRRQVQERTY